MTKRRRLRIAPVLLIALAVLAAIVLPAAGTRAASGLSPLALQHLSQGPLAHYYIANPSAAPQQLQTRFTTLHQIATTKQVPPATKSPRLPSVSTPLFNADTIGLPQNEESITSCKQHSPNVLGGTNDYRGLLDPEGNFTGWHYSTNGGASLSKEGLLPSINGIPSGGDPVDIAGVVSVRSATHCAFFAGSLNYSDPNNPTAGTNGIGLYKTTPSTLSSAACGNAGPSDPDCWPTRRLVATNAFGHFLDKEWIYAGVSAGQQYVWVVWSDFDLVTNPPFTASIMASRCTDDLVTCTAPQLISGSDQDIQFGDVTIGPDGRTYITWSEIQGELQGTPQTFIHKLRIAPAGSTVFGPTQVVATETKPLPFGGFLQANDFRIATYPKNDVALVGSTPRIFVIWDACTTRILGENVCENPVIKLAYSDNDGASWTTGTLSAGGVNYFPTISVDPVGGYSKVVTAWYTNRFDSFGNAQDVEVATFPASSPSSPSRARLTSPSNEPEADPVLGGFFIGDYFEVFAFNSSALVHFNANYRQVATLGGELVNQQDNFLARYP